MNMLIVNEFHKELEALLNKHCMENESGTPDFILANYLMACLRAFEAATIARDSWHDPGSADEAPR